MNSKIKLSIVILMVCIMTVGCTLNGKLIATAEGDTISNRQIGLCQIAGDVSNLPTDCTLMDLTSTSNEQGEFQISGISQGKYFVLYNTGLSDFQSGFDKWKGKTLKLSDINWVASDYCGTPLDKLTTDIHLVSGMSLMLPDIEVAIRDLYFCHSPFVLALDPTSGNNAPLVVDVKGGTTKVEILVHDFENAK